MRLARRASAPALLAAFLCLLAAAALAAPSFPSLTGRVVDGADILPPQTEAELSAKLEGLERSTGRQLVVATLPSLQGYEIEEYGYQLGRTWGIGRAEQDDGALLIVAPNERKVRVEVGYGLEGVLTDALSSVILQERVLPRFRDGDLAGGVVAGTEALIEQLSLDPEAAAQRLAEAETAQASDGGFDWFTLFVTIMIIFWVMRMFSRRGRRGGWWIPPVVIGGGSSSGWSGRDWGGGRGGGGFSGGGGSFGGGGSSGSW